MSFCKVAFYAQIHLLEVRLDLSAPLQKENSILKKFKQLDKASPNS